MERHPAPLASSAQLIRDALDRLVLPLLLLVSAIVGGTMGFYILGDGRWTLFESLFLTSITLTTVGYGELHDMNDEARLFAILLMWSGMGVALYSVSAVTAFVVERDLGKFLKERKMEKRIAALKDHYIVCGAGRTGSHIVQELYLTKRPAIVIELDPDRIDWLAEHFPDLPTIHGDATEEDILHRAGIDRAAGVIANVREDSRNLLITVQARFQRPDVKVVARAEDNKLVEKFRRAGADYVVNPSYIGGMRMVSEMVRPHVVSFLDRMLRGSDASVRVEEAIVEPDSKLAGKALRDAKLFEHTGLRPLAVQTPDADHPLYNVGDDVCLQPGTVLYAIGNPQQISALRDLCRG